MDSKHTLTTRYVEAVLDNLGTIDLQNFFYDRFFTEVSQYTMDELLEEVEEYHPELLTAVF